MDGISVKEEDRPAVKSEIDAYPPAKFEDDDDYEDTGELAIPSNAPALWLARVPDYLWETLSGMNDDEEIKIGKIRIWQQQGQSKVAL